MIRNSPTCRNEASTAGSVRMVLKLSRPTNGCGTVTPGAVKK
jgi:hypothetical protein